MIHEHGNVFDVIIVDKTLNRNTRLGRLAFTAICHRIYLKNTDGLNLHRKASDLIGQFI